MINVNDPLIKRFIDNLHKAVERKNKNLSLIPYDDYIRENRIIKIFCEDKTRGLRECAAEMNARYQTKLDNEDIIRVLKANRLNYQDKRAELLNWAEEVVEAFIKALETQKPKAFDEFMTIRNRVIRTKSNERYKIQERITSIMLYVRHPELNSGTDAEAIEKFGNVYMKHFFYDASDFLRNICHAISPKNVTEMTFNDFLLFLQTKYPELAGNVDFTIFDRFDGILMQELLIEAKNFLNGLSHVEIKIVMEMTFNDFLLFLQTKYPELAGNVDFTIFDKFDGVSMQELLIEAKNFLNGLPSFEISDENFIFGTTFEDFLHNDPDAQNMLIAPLMHNAVD